MQEPPPKSRLGRPNDESLPRTPITFFCCHLCFFSRNIGFPPSAANTSSSRSRKDGSRTPRLGLPRCHRAEILLAMGVWEGAYMGGSVFCFGKKALWPSPPPPSPIPIFGLLTPPPPLSLSPPPPSDSQMTRRHRSGQLVNGQRWTLER
jgi:hypothetical protein